MKLKNFKLSILAVLLLSVSMFSSQDLGDKILSIYWCGASEGFCDQSAGVDDVYDSATHVIIAYAQLDENGLQYADFDTNLIHQWQNEGKRVLLSIGGSQTKIEYAFANQGYISLASTLLQIVAENDLDGIDFELLSYQQSAKDVIDGIQTYRTFLGDDKDIVLTVQNVNIYPTSGLAVPGENETGIFWNYFVPILKQAEFAISFVQVQCYNNAYFDAPVGSALYLETVYKSWLNKRSAYTIPNFSGISEEKLVLSVFASKTAGDSSYYYTPEILIQAFQNLVNEGYNPQGINIWNSYWDTLNNKLISKAAHEALLLEAEEPSEPTEPTEPEEPTEGICYYQHCGCPGAFLESYCTVNAFFQSSWCQENATQCKQCAGTWCA